MMKKEKTITSGADGVCHSSFAASNQMEQLCARKERQRWRVLLGNDEQEERTNVPQAISHGREAVEYAHRWWPMEYAKAAVQCGNDESPQE
jgi:hypothetical protein